jgi:hypothetical protein
MALLRPVATEAELVAVSADEVEAAPLGDSLRGGVVDVTPKVDAPQSKLTRSPGDQCRERA